MRLLVTGAEGFVGSHIIHNLGAIPVTSDVTDFEGLYQEVREKSEGQHFTLIHTAALTDVELCEKNRDLAYKVNVRGTDNVLASMPKTGKVILLSSCHVFSGRNFFPYSEKHIPEPCNWYGSTKYGAEAVLATYRVPSVAVRLGRVYDGNWEQRIIMSDDPVPSFLKRNFIHIEDAVNILGRVAQADFNKFPLFKKLYRVLHVGNPDNNFTYSQFYGIVRAKFGKSPLAVRTQYEERETERPMRCALNVKQMQNLFDYSFREI